MIKHFPEQAGWCHLLGSPFTAHLLEAMGRDYEAGGSVARLLHDYGGNPRKDALGLRIAGCLHHAVLTGAAPSLAAVYPAANPNTTAAAAWPQITAFLDNHAQHVRAFIQSAPQTNETRRAIALLPAFLEASRAYPDLPLHMVELGASAGLNTQWDKFTYKTDTWHRAGSSDVTITTDWRAPPLVAPGAPLPIASRTACDLNPLDIHDQNAVDRIRCYIWPDQSERLARLDAAIALARTTDTQVIRASADTFLDSVLHDWQASTAPGHLVIYHSVFLQYPPRPVIEGIIARIQAAGESASPQRPVSWICFEPSTLFDKSKPQGEMSTRWQSWPGAVARTLLRSDGHVTKVDAP